MINISNAQFNQNLDLDFVSDFSMTYWYWSTYLQDTDMKLGQEIENQPLNEILTFLIVLVSLLLLKGNYGIKNSDTRSMNRF